MAPDDADAPDEIDFDDRELCSDDACIGVIGEDGKCNECGRAGKRPAGGARAVNVNVNTNANGASAADKAKAHLDKAFKADKGGKPDKQLSKPPKAGKAGSGAGAAGGGDGDSDWDNRELCSDGSCIGVIGKNGKCNECGKAAG